MPWKESFKIITLLRNRFLFHFSFGHGKIKSRIIRFSVFVSFSIWHGYIQVSISVPSTGRFICWGGAFFFLRTVFCGWSQYLAINLRIVICHRELARIRCKSYIKRKVKSQCILSWWFILNKAITISDTHFTNNILKGVCHYNCHNYCQYCCCFC